ncbi:MAG: tryptophan synthase subunit alpha, partial [Bacillus sp. (in: firmicutes)]
MSRIQQAFKKLKDKNEKAFVPYIMAGDGGLDVLAQRILFLEKCGATAIEIGIPFSDPVADGPTIQQAG